MSLEIQQRDNEGITVLEMKGRITVGKEATALREKVAELAAANVRNLVFNLREVDYIDSTGLGALVMCATTLRKAGGNVKLVNPASFVAKTFKMVGIISLFTVYESEADAVDACGG